MNREKLEKIAKDLENAIPLANTQDSREALIIACDRVYAAILAEEDQTVKMLTKAREAWRKA